MSVLIARRLLKGVTSRDPAMVFKTPIVLDTPSSPLLPAALPEGQAVQGKCHKDQPRSSPSRVHWIVFTMPN